MAVTVTPEILDKVRKLRRLAVCVPGDSPERINEAQAAAGMATRIMAKFGITEARLTEPEPTRHRPQPRAGRGPFTSPFQDHTVQDWEEFIRNYWWGSPYGPGRPKQSTQAPPETADQRAIRQLTNQIHNLEHLLSEAKAGLRREQELHQIKLKRYKETLAAQGRRLADLELQAKTAQYRENLHWWDRILEGILNEND